MGDNADALMEQRLRQLEAENWQLMRRVLQLEMLLDVLNEVNAGETLPATLSSVLSVLIGTFGARCGLAIWHDDANAAWRVAANRGVDDAFVDALLQRLPRHPQCDHAADLTCWVEQTLPVCACLQGKRQALGLVALGEKLTGEPFSAEDHAMVKAAMREAATAIENSKLLELSHLKDRFLLNIAHNLTNPLFGIESIVKLLLNGQHGDLTPSQREWLLNVQCGVQQLRMLVDDINQLARINFGRLELQRQPLQIRDVICHTVAAARAHAQSRHITLRVDAPDNLPLVEGDFNCLCQILTNLLSNAVKYSPDKSEVKITARQDAAELIVSVSDKGIGIRKADQKRLFQDFFRADDARIKRIEGTGLGLSITKRLVELHGGRIWAESAFRKGSTFSFSLPLNSGN
ncbi:MAG: ATP-binding protein [Abditibacteriales bacterium]|nr:ATP-binding protein [Abditibacteriales bacterium]MDW8367892.1 ATP-binding protein [Abditibacteriales bacterium]